MEKDKIEWLKSIGAAEFPETIKYIYAFPGYNGAFNLSEKYVEDTPLKELKDQYKKNGEYAKGVIEAEKLRDSFRQGAEHF